MVVGVWEGLGVMVLARVWVTVGVKVRVCVLVGVKVWLDVGVAGRGVVFSPQPTLPNSIKSSNNVSRRLAGFQSMKRDAFNRFMQAE